MHTGIFRQVRLVKHAYRMLLRVNILTRNLKIFVIIDANTKILSDFVCNLLSTQYGACTLAYAYSITTTVGVKTEDMFSLCQNLVIGNKTCTYIDNVYVIDNLFRSWNRLEVLALSNYSALYSCIIVIRNCLQQYVRCKDWNTKTAYTVCLNRETALMVHTFDDCLDFGASLHSLI